MTARPIKTSWCKVAALTIAASAAIPMAAMADAETHEINGVNWTFCERNDTELTITLGAHDASEDKNITNPAKAIDTSLSIDVADIPWKVTIDDKVYTVTKIGRYAFNSCANLTGTLTIPDEVIHIGRYAFANSGLEHIASLGGVDQLDGYAFQNTGSAAYPFPDLSKVRVYNKTGDGGGVNHAFENARYSGVAYLYSGDQNAVPGRFSFSGCSNLVGVCCMGTATVQSGQTYTMIGRFCSFKNATSLKIIFAGPNTRAVSNTASGKTYHWLEGVAGCKVVIPDNGQWASPDVGSGNEAIYYGGSRGLDIDADNDAKKVAISAADASALEKALELAPLFNEVFGWEVRIDVPSGIDMSGGAVDGGLFAANKLPAVFAVKTQAQLDKVLAVVPSASLLAIDPTGATESLTMPQDRAVWVYLAGNGQYRKIKGTTISFY